MAPVVAQMCLAPQEGSKLFKHPLNRARSRLYPEPLLPCFDFLAKQKGRRVKRRPSLVAAGQARQLTISPLAPPVSRAGELPTTASDERFGKPILGGRLSPSATGPEEPVIPGNLGPPVR